MADKPKKDQDKEPGSKFESTVKRMLDTPPKPHQKPRPKQSDGPDKPKLGKTD